MLFFLHYFSRNVLKLNTRLLHLLLSHNPYSKKDPQYFPSSSTSSRIPPNTNMIRTSSGPPFTISWVMNTQLTMEQLPRDTTSEEVPGETIPRKVPEKTFLEKCLRGHSGGAMSWVILEYNILPLFIKIKNSISSGFISIS